MNAFKSDKCTIVEIGLMVSTLTSNMKKTTTFFSNTKQKLFLLFLFMLVCFAGLAQETPDLKPYDWCRSLEFSATAIFEEPQSVPDCEECLALTESCYHPDGLNGAEDCDFELPACTWRLPMQYHVLNSAAGYPGDGAIDNLIDDEMAALNALYAPIGVEFYECAATNFIADSNGGDGIWNGSEDDGLQTGATAITDNFDQAGVINVYLVDGFSNGICGYAYYPTSTSTALNHMVYSYQTSGCGFGTANTSGHELGHFLGLYHTHTDAVTQEVPGAGGLSDPNIYCADCDVRDPIGDCIFDTNPDPKLNEGVCVDPADATCDQPCITGVCSTCYVDVCNDCVYSGPVGYDPNLTNIMNYNPWTTCSGTDFTTCQFAKMSDELNYCKGISLDGCMPDPIAPANVSICADATVNEVATTTTGTPFSAECFAWWDTDTGGTPISQSEKIRPPIPTVGVCLVPGVYDFWVSNANIFECGMVESNRIPFTVTVTPCNNCPPTTCPDVTNITNSAFVCPNALASQITEWQDDIETANATAIADPNTDNVVTYSTLPTNSNPTGCNNLVETVTATLNCFGSDGVDDGGANDDVSLTLGTFTLTTFPAAQAPAGDIVGCTNTPIRACVGDTFGALSNPTGGASAANWDGTTYTAQPGDVAGTIDIEVITANACTSTFFIYSIITPACDDIDCDDVDNGGLDICDILANNPASSLATLDCDGGGIDNATECANGGNPASGADECAVAIAAGIDICAELLADPASPLGALDCDGGGVDNATECANGGNPVSGADECAVAIAASIDICAILLANPASPLGVLDCDGGGVDNATECDPDGNPATNDATNPLDVADDACADAIAAGTDICATLLADPANALATLDCDGGGINNITECNGLDGDPTTPDGTDPLNQADDICDLDVVCPLTSAAISCDAANLDAAALFALIGGTINPGAACGVVDITSDFLDPGVCGGNVVTTFRITDGNVLQSCVSTITVNPPAPPTIVACAPGADIACSSEAVADVDLIDFTTECGADATVTVIVSPATLNSLCGESPGDQYTANYTVTDDCGNTAFCAQIFTIVNPKPTITACAPDMDVACFADIVADITAVQFDNCGLNTDVVAGVVVATGGNSACGESTGDRYTIEYTVTDDCGGMNTCIQTFTIVNDELTIACPGDEIVNCFADIAVDAANANITVSCNLGFGSDVDGPVIDGDEDCPGTTYTYTYRAQDVCGNVASCEQIFTIAADNLVVNCPTNIVGLTCVDDLPTAETTLSGSSNCDPAADFTVINVEDSDLPTSFCTGGNLVVTRTYTVEDACGTQGQCTQTFTFDPDLEAPVIAACPADVTLACNAALPAAAVVLFGTDNCDTPIEFAVIDVVDTDLPTSFCVGDNLEVRRTYTIADACGNESECTQTFTFEADVEGPIIDCPGDVSGLTCVDALPATETMLSGTDNCDTATEFAVIDVVDSDLPTSFCIGSNLEVTRTYTVADACGNVSQCTQTFTFDADVEGPVITTCPADITLACGDALPTSVTTLFGTDNCDTPIEFTVIDVVDSDLPTSFCTGSNLEVTRTYTVADACGNESECIQTFTFEADDVPPVVDCPGDVSGLTCVDDLPPAETMLSGTDNCDAATEFAVIDVVDSGLPTSFCTGSNLEVIRTYTVADACGNTAQCTQTFRFEADTEAPVITCPDDVSGLACGDALPVAETMLPGTDNCDTATEFAVVDVIDEVLPSSFCIGDNLEILRIYIVEDACGNQIGCEQIFRFDADAEGPTIDCPGDVTGLTCVDDLPPAETMLSGTDNCDAATEFAVIDVVDSGLPTSFCTGSNLEVTRTYTVADACGNATQCTQTFRFEADVEGPTVDCPADVTGLACDADLPAAETMLSGTDNCDAATEFAVIDVVDSGLPTSFCTGSNLEVTRTYTVADACGNATQCTQTFRFEADVEGPTVDCPADVTGLACDADLPAAETMLSGTDNCDAATEFAVIDVVDGDLPTNFCAGSSLGVTRTYTVADACGNATQCTQTFTFAEDTEGPVITCPDDVTGLTCGDVLPAAETMLSGTDNCDTATEFAVIAVDDEDLLTSFCAFDYLTVIRTYTVADNCGNQTQCTQVFTFEEDTEAPIIDCLPDVDGLTCGDVLPPPATTLSGTDNCDPATEFTVVSEVNSGLPTSFCEGDLLAVLREYTVRDACGNETVCEQVFTFLPNDVPPTIICPEDCPVACASDIRPGVPEFTTSCGGIGTLSVSDPVIDGDPHCDGTTYTYTHTVTDDCGLVASCDQVFTIVNECHLIDFDFDDEGNPLAPGTHIFDQYDDFTVTTENPHRCAQLFDTGDPTSNDFDLGTPNEAYGGPGIGAGGANNTDFQGNALIVSYDCGVPNEKEGKLIFDFDCSVTIKTVDLLDMKCGESEVELYDEHGNQIGYLDIPGYGVNSFNTFDVNISGVYQMIIDLDCGGGVTGFKYCKDNAPGTDCEAPESVCEDYNLDFDNNGYHWTTNGTSGSFDVGDQNYTISIADDDGILEDTYESNGGLLIGIDPHDVDDQVIVCYNLSQVSDNVWFDIFDLDYKDSNSKQQEAVCVYGLLGDDLTQVMPNITSLDGHVDINGNCAEATTNSAISGDDESVLVEFSDCIDKVVIVYGTGSDSPTADPSYSKITIGESIGFNSEVCPGDCLPDCGSSGDDDGDGVCNDVDVCPGGDDNIDSDGDGIPNACDDICYDYNVDHGDCGAGWGHDDLSGSVELGNETIDISIVDEDNIFVDSEANGAGLQVGIDPHTTDDELVLCYNLSQSSSHVVFDIVDLDYKNSGSRQQEAVCVYGTLGNDPTPILPTITSLDGSVDIDGNCAEATTNSAISGDDESILVEFTECIDKITIMYGTGSNSPTHDPSYSKITIGESIFSVEQCKDGCDEPCAVAGSGGGDGDADGDGVCDDEDICEGGDDFMDTDGDGTPDFCDDDCTAGSSPIGDDDGDFVCNDVDQCPGFDDNIDENNNGIPDGCDIECEDYTLDFAEDGYDWSGHNLMESYTVGDQTFDIRIIDGDNILENSHDRDSGLAIGTDPHDVNDNVVVCYNLSQVASNVLFDIVDLDFKDGGSRQQEAVCIYGTLGVDPTEIMPNITSLEGSVAISGNCAEATANSSISGEDESILVEFTECIDKITIVYGTGSDSPTHDPDYGKITIGQDYGFITEVCSNTCPDPREGDETNAHISLYPNPVYGSSNVTIEIDTEARGDAQIILVDALGRIVSTENIQLVNDLTIHQFSTNQLAAGVYFVQLQTQEWRTDGMKLVVVKP